MRVMTVKNSLIGFFFSVILITAYIFFDDDIKLNNFIGILIVFCFYLPSIFFFGCWYSRAKDTEDEEKNNAERK